jgi:carbon storage regulator
MLVLSRRLGETIVIGDSIKITVLGVSGNQVRLGVSAPEHIPVHREEVALRIRREALNNKRTTTSDSTSNGVPLSHAK